MHSYKQFHFLPMPPLVFSFFSFIITHSHANGQCTTYEVYTHAYSPYRSSHFNHTLAIYFYSNETSPHLPLFLFLWLVVFFCATHSHTWNNWDLCSLITMCRCRLRRWKFPVGFHTPIFGIVNKHTGAAAKRCDLIWFIFSLSLYLVRSRQKSALQTTIDG